MKQFLAGVALLMSVGGVNATVLTSTTAITFSACGTGALCTNFQNVRGNAASHATDSFNDYYTFTFNPSQFVPSANGAATLTFSMLWNTLGPSGPDGQFTTVTFWNDNGVVGAGGGDTLISTAANIGLVAFPAATLTGGNYYIQAQGTFNTTPVEPFNQAGYQGGGRIAAISAVPEPSEWALMLSGLGLMGFMARRRRNASRAA